MDFMWFVRECRQQGCTPDEAMWILKMVGLYKQFCEWAALLEASIKAGTTQVTK